jgi:glycyl-tRNA synthetase (class II)
MKFMERSAIEMAFISRFRKENYRFHDHEKLAHYANAASDIEFNFPFGFKELEGIHSRI